jgi:predicted nucleic acid-binding protein
VSDRVFLDTNVLVYAYDESDERRFPAQALLQWLSDRELGAVSTQVLGEFYTTTTRKLPLPLSAEDAEARTTNFARWWRVIDVTSSAVLEAVRASRRYQLSYWDALIWATAKLNGIFEVFTEDFSDRLLIEDVRFLSPFADSFTLEDLEPTQ